MDKVKEVEDREKAARLDAGAAKRMVKHSLFNPDDHKVHNYALGWIAAVNIMLGSRARISTNEKENQKKI